MLKRKGTGYRRFEFALILAAIFCSPIFLWADYTTTVLPTTSWGAWQGWGTSLCWMGKAFGNQTNVTDALFGTGTSTLSGTSLPGLGINVARYNAGACGTGSVNGNSMVINAIPAGRQIQGYWLNPNSTDPTSSSWNWSVDANQRAMLQRAAGLGANKFELFSNSPMWWMLDNYNPAGGSGGADNLNPSYTQDFAIYLATIAKYAKANWGITFTSVEPFNEPNEGWWKSTNNQEGCDFSHAAQPAVISALRTEMDNQGLASMPVATSDENKVNEEISTWNSFNSATQLLMGQINSHGYDGTSGNTAGLYNLAVAGGKALIMNEYGDGDTTGMTMAKVINYHLNTLHPSEWVYWQILDASGWGMINADIGNQTYSGVNKKYFVFAQYSAHVRPGMTIINSGDANTVSAYNAGTGTLVLVTTNYGTAQNITYNLSNFEVVGGPVTQWVTDTGSGVNYAESTGPSLSGKTFSSAFAANSVQTFEIHGVYLTKNSGTATPTKTMSNTPTPIKTNTPIPPTVTFTPTHTNSPTSTETATSTATRTSTATFTFTPTVTSTSTATKTNTAVPPTSTFTATFTSTSTRANTPVPPTFTNTPVPPTATSTNSPVPPTVTNTPAPPTITNTPAPPTATSTNTPVLPTATSTNSPVPPSPTPTPVTGQVVLQAEDACSFTGTLDSNHLGFTGTGFVNLTNNNTAGITFALNSTTAQNLTVTIRYSNGTTTARPMVLSRVSPSVSSALTVNFATTANWDTWVTIGVTVPLVAGNNQIQLVPTATNNNGGPNLDEFTFTSSTVTVGTCGAAALAKLAIGEPNASKESTSKVLAEPNISRNGAPIQFRVELEQPGEIQLTLFAVTGEKVFQEQIQGHAGENMMTWNLANQTGSPVASGLYLFAIQAPSGDGAGPWTGKVVVIH